MNQTARQIAVARVQGSLAVNDDGELVYKKSELQAEVLTPEQTILRWPAAGTADPPGAATLD
jgi:hypothetical protein